MAGAAYEVRAIRDSEARVWVATSADVPGLVTEAPTKAELERKLRALVPELLEFNGEPIPEDRRIPVHLVTERSKDFVVQAAG